MNAIIQSKKVTLPEGLYQRWLEQLAKCQQRYLHLTKLTAKISQEKNKWFRVLITATTPKKQHIIESTQPQLAAAFQAAILKLTRHLRKDKERRRAWK